MAIENAKTLNVRIKNKYDSYENWAGSGLVLEAGEIAIAYTTVDVKVDNGTAKHPALLMKVGDGEKTFANLPWMSAKAADVLAVCKDETALTEFVNSVITDAGVATDDALKTLSNQVSTNKTNIETLQSDLDTAETGLKARVTTAEEVIAALQELVGDEGTVAAQIDAKIAALNLPETYDAKGAAAAAQEAAEAHADELNADMDARMVVVEGKAHEHANKDVLDGITAEKVAAWDAAEGNAIAHADELDEAMDARVLALEGKFGDGEGNVESQIEAAVAAEAKARDDADKALQALIEANDAEILALQGLVGDVNVAEALADEKERAEAAEKANADAIAAIEADYLKAADKEALQTQIDTIMNNPDTEGVINSINEFTQYIADHGAIADGFRKDIDDNKDAIAAEKERAEGIEGGLETRLQAVEAAVGAEGSVAGDIADALAEAKGYTDAEVKKLVDGAVTDNANAIAELQGKVGDDSVQDQIDAALKVDGVEKYALATDLVKTDEEVAKKANDEDLADIAKTGSTDDLVIGEMVLVFDCGTSAI